MELETSLKTAKFFGLTILVSTTLVAVLLVWCPALFRRHATALETTSAIGCGTCQQE